MTGFVVVDRFVQEVGVDAPLDDDGFLLPQYVGAGARNAPVAVSTLVGSARSAVLLAPGGSGKTIAIHRWHDDEPGSQLIDLLSLASGDLRNVFAEAVDVGGSVFVDGIDVIVREVPTFLNFLRKFVTSGAGKDVVWRFACRPAVWTSIAENIAEYRLLPLDVLAARTAIADVVDDPDAFMEALIDARLGRLAGCPLQLRQAAKHWRQTGQLASDQIESIQDEISRLLQEHGDGYSAAMPLDRQKRLAQRLAAFSVFCGASAFAVKPQFSSPSMPALADLPSTPEPDAPGSHVEVAELEVVIGSALFEAGSSGVVVFRHQQYAEYLAAKYLITRQVTARQLLDILGVREGIIPASQMGVAAWVAALEPSLVTELIAPNDLQLARSGIDLPDVVRVALTESLLSSAATAAGDVDWAVDTDRLVHGELEGQLHRYAAQGTSGTLAWWLGSLTEAGRYETLADTMLSLSLDATNPAYARRATVAALAQVGSEHHLHALNALLRLDAAADPDDEVLAAAVAALHPRLMTTAEVVDVLRPRRNRMFFGAYLRLFADLAENSAPADISIMLRWLAAQGHHRELENAYGWLAEKLIDRAWRILDTPGMHDNLVELLAAMVGPPDFGNTADSHRMPWNADTEVDRRRHLALALAARLPASQWFELLHLGLLATDDADWLLDILPKISATAQASVAECLSPLLPQPTAAQADRVLSLPPSHPAYETTRDWRDPIEVDSEWAKRLKRAHQRQQETHQRRVEVATRQITGLIQALAESAADMTQWWRITYWLGEGISGHDEVFSHDLTTRSGWKYLAEPEREQVIRTGLVYLQQHHLRPEEWFGQQRIDVLEVLPDWSGVYLMTTLARHRPELLADLSPQTCQRWAPAIVGAWNYDRNDDAELRADLADLAPAEGLTAISHAALNYLDAVNPQDGTLSIRPLFKRLLPTLVHEVAERVTQERYGAHLTRSLLDLLIEVDPDQATDLSQHLAASSDAALNTIGQTALGRMAPARTVKDLLAQPDAERLASVVPHMRVDVLDDADLETLGRLLLTVFAFDEDPPLEEVSFSSPQQQVREVRRRVLDLLRDRGNANALTRLATNDNRPINTTALLRHARTARQKAASNAYASNQPAELLKLVARSDTRLVRNDADLMTVVIEQLTDLEREIRTGAHTDLWNENAPKSEDTISDWIKRHLQTRLSHGVVDREIQVQRRSDRGFGTRIDLTATSPTTTHPARTARIIIEAKLINNKHLETALSNQLVAQYLQPTNHPYGIYLVYWIDRIQRPSTWKRKGPTVRDALLRKLGQQAASHPKFHIVPLFLDISRPQSTDGSAK